MNGLYRITILITGVSLLSKILGFIREMIYASYFGTTDEMDAFIIATLIPITINAFLQGALVTAFVPVYNELLTKNLKKEANVLANNLLLIILILGSFFVFLNFFISDYVISILVPGFLAGKLSITIEMTNIVMLSIVFSGAFGILKGIEEANCRFLYPAIAVAGSNLIVIIFIALAKNTFHVYTLPIGFIVGFICQIIILLPGLRNIDFKLNFFISYSKDTGRVIKLAFPIILGASAGYINLLVDKMFASSLSSGSISALNYASKLNLAIAAISSISIATAIYPDLIKYYTCNNMKKYSDTLISGIKFILVINMPIAFFLFAFHTEIISILFKRGTFDDQAVVMTAIALKFFSIGIVFYGVIEVLNRAFFALQDTRTPVLVSCVSIFVNVILNYIFIEKLGHGGIALANSIALLSGASLLFFLLLKKIKFLKINKVLTIIPSLFINIGITGIVLWFLNKIIIFNFSIFLWKIVFFVFIGIMMYLFIGCLIKDEMIMLLYRAIKRKD